jgi:hypothetical protein
MAMGFVIASLGDVAAQRIMVEEKPEPKEPSVTEKFKIDMKRTMEMGVIRALLVAPFIQIWYPLVVDLFPGSSWLTIFYRVIFDQVVGTPIVIFLAFAGSIVLQRKSLQHFIDLWKKNFMITWIKGFQYWPFVHTFTYGVIEPDLRSLWAHFASVYWNMVLSFYANKK